MTDDPWAAYVQPQAAAPDPWAQYVAPAAPDPWAQYVAPAAPADTTPSLGYRLGATMLPALQGATLGAGTKALAAIGGAASAVTGGSFGDTYQSDLDALNKQLAYQKNAHPYFSTASEIAGATLPAVATMGTTAPVSAALGGGAVADAAALGIQGAGLAATQAAVTPDNATAAQRLSAGMKAAPMGALGGVASVPIGQAAGAVAGKIAGKIGDWQYGNQYGAALPADAADDLNTILARQGDTGASALPKVAAMGSPAVLADSGTGTQQYLGRLAAQAPNAGPTIQQNLTDRAAQFGPRLNTAVDNAAGPDVNAVTQMAALKATTAANGAANYNAALNSGATVDLTPARDLIAQTRVDPIVAGVKEDPISQALKSAQSLFVGNNPAAVDVKVAHQAQAAIGDMAGSALRSGNNEQARALLQVQKSIQGQMPADYTAARTQYADDKQIEEAFADGRNIFAPRSDGQVFDPDLHASMLAQMPKPAQDAYALGTRKALADTMGQARTDAAGVQTKLANNNGYAIGKLQQVIGGQKTAGLMQELQNLKTMQATNQEGLSGSQTAERLATDSAIPTNAPVKPVGNHIGGPVGAIIAAHELGFDPMQSGAVGAAAAVAKGAWNRFAIPAINASRQSAQDSSRMALARALTAPPSQALGPALASRAAQPAATAATAATTAAIARKLAQALGWQAGRAAQ